MWNNSIRYLIILKSSIKYVLSHYNAKIKAVSYNSLLMEKTLNFHNATILIKSVRNKYQNHYNYNISLETCSYQTS